MAEVEQTADQRGTATTKNDDAPATSRRAQRDVSDEGRSEGDRDGATRHDASDAPDLNSPRRRMEDADDAPDVATKKPFYRRPVFLILAAIVLVAGLIYGLTRYFHARAHESTDDAFIESNVVQVSPKVAANVVRVLVSDNQVVKKGDLLVELDPRDYETRLQQARAMLQAAIARREQARSNTSLTRVTTAATVSQAASGVGTARANAEATRSVAAARRSNYDQAGAGIQTAAANAEQARSEARAAEAQAARDKADVERYGQLYEKDEVSRQRFDQAIAAARTSEAQAEAARKRVAANEAQVAQARAAQNTAASDYRQSVAQISAAESQIGEARGRLADANAAPERVRVSTTQVNSAEAEIAQAQAQAAQAELDLSYTKIYAPEAGRVTRKAVDEGQLVGVGQSLMGIVYGDVWITANYKETQLNKMRIGQPVEIKVDAYPDRTFRGHVESFQSGTGSRFSLLPPENATGNYVKVVQRVPVKILFDEQPDDAHLLAPGMSVIPEVNIDAAPQQISDRARRGAQGGGETQEGGGATMGNGGGQSGQGAQGSQSGGQNGQNGQDGGQGSNGGNGESNGGDGGGGR